MHFTVRRAREDDIPTIVTIKTESFSDSPYQKAIFPDHLRIKPGLQDQLDHYGPRMKRSAQDPCNYYVVAVVLDESGNEVIAGFAKWVAPNDGRRAQPAQSQAGTAGTDEATVKRTPECLDTAAAERSDGEIAQMMKAAMPLFGDKKLSDMWTLNSIAVDERYRSRGIGKALTRWGMDAADAEGKDIWLISAPSGRAMYLSLGFQQYTSLTDTRPRMRLAK
ncbi:acetyltransferase (GNAT) family domain-containing protein [Purpureocillium lilacinum]|uniref:Acetyltransferase (GNAT) family domain-containing protein n=1 Tax=Purpureocillium lilacinum TaxID=33203 RepID=A0A179HW18_PURLI|nr:acetyltransferase (GNAT) family domain-containing protein [Purpureocillium lilacinum]OAQ93751.1 acetyltransferase (GNAT) family domain-containing protein [Purpureocillium lilacinum]